MLTEGQFCKTAPFCLGNLTLNCKKNEVQRHLMAAQTTVTESMHLLDSIHAIIPALTHMHPCSHAILQSQGGWDAVPSTVPILLVKTESVWSSQPPPLRPSLNFIRMDWLLNRTTRIRMAAVTVVECRCSSINIIIQSKPSVLTSSSQALIKKREKTKSHFTAFSFLLDSKKKNQCPLQSKLQNQKIQIYWRVNWILR